MPTAKPWWVHHAPLHGHPRVMLRSSMHFRQTTASSSYQGGSSSEVHDTTSYFGTCHSSANATVTRISQGKSSPSKVNLTCLKADRSPPSMINCAKSGRNMHSSILTAVLGTNDLHLTARSDSFTASN